MKLIVTGLGIMLLALGCGTETQDEKSEQALPAAGKATSTVNRVNKKAEIARADAAITDFAAALSLELKSAMETGGPVAAIGVCNTRAVAITGQLGNRHNMRLSRVSLKYRNPSNKPNKWQAAVLRKFDQRKADGEDPASLTWSKITGEDSNREFRYMKAIPTTGVCLQCHGAQLSPELKEVLAGLYPGDRATGFSEGDIRGAFVVTRKIR